MQNKISKESLSPALSKMIDVGMSEQNARAELSFALQLVHQDKNLIKCSVLSVVKALVNLANFGLSLSPAAKECYLTAKYNRQVGALEAKLEPSYIGLAKLLINSGGVKSILVQWAFANDKIKIDLADDQKPVTHEPLMFGVRGDKVGVYAVATLKDNRKQCEFMSVEEIQGIRDRADSYKAYVAGKIKTCPWHSDFGEMGRKTVLKRFYKYLPKGDNSKKIEEAIKLDNEDYGAEFWQLHKIEQLLTSANLEERTLRMIESELSDMSRDRAFELINFLKENQVPNNVRYNGGATNMTGVGEAVKEAVEMTNT